MTPQSPLPRLGRWLLRIAPLGSRREEVDADLLELFRAREMERGARFARRRYWGDVISLLRRRAIEAPASGRRQGQQFWQGTAGDLRYAVRLFARRPATFLLTVGGLGLGLAVATATLSIVNAVAVRGDGVPDPATAPKVMRITDRSMSTVWKYREFQHLRDGARNMQVEAVLSDAAHFRTVPGESAAPAPGVAFVSGGFFQAMAGRTAHGRTLLPADEQRTDVVPIVVSDSFWTRALGGDPSVVGRTVWLGRSAAIIVGVMEPGFKAPVNRNTAMWAPLVAYGSVYGGDNIGRDSDLAVDVIGRLAPGVSLSEAEGQLSAVAAVLSGDAAPSHDRLRVRLDPAARLGRDGSGQVVIVTVILVLTALVLSLAAGNVAMVLIATAIGREREMALRLALGAGRRRIVRQLVTEGLTLGCAGAVIGAGLATWTMPVLTRMLRVPEDVDIAPDMSVYFVSFVMSLLVGAGAGLAPAWHGRGADILSPLKGDGASHIQAGPKRLRSLLVLTQTAASVILIMVAALFLRATWHVAQIDVGFDAASLYTVSAGFGSTTDAASDARRRAYWNRAVTEMAGHPGIESVSLAEFAPFGNSAHTSSKGEGNARVVIHWNRTRSDYFATMGLRVLRGRAYTPAEVAAKAPVALISESVARRYWGDESPLGSTLDRVGQGNRAEVIGVVADAITARLHERSSSAVYRPLDPASERFAHMLVRVAPGDSGRLEQARELLRAIDPQAEVRIESVGEQLRVEAERPGLLAALAGIVGALAMMLCVIGIYGLTAAIVGQRTREIGVRMALGADRSQVIVLLLGDSLRPVMIGLLIGTGAAIGIARVIAAALYGVSPHDPLALASAALLVLLASVLSALMPTRRAAAVDPAFVLRQS